MPTSEIAQLGSYGLIGVMLGLILLVAGVVLLLYKIVSKHIHHSTQAALKSIQVMERLAVMIEAKL